MPLFLGEELASGNVLESLAPFLLVTVLERAGDELPFWPLEVTGALVVDSISLAELTLPPSVLDGFPLRSMPKAFLSDVITAARVEGSRVAQWCGDVASCQRDKDQ